MEPMDYREVVRIAEKGRKGLSVSAFFRVPPVRTQPSINPDTTAAVALSIDECARKAPAPGSEIVTVNPARGPESIAGCVDEPLAAVVWL